MNERAPDVDDVLAALADPTRRRVLDVIAARGEATATAVASELPVSRQAVVKHLAVLDRAGLVTARRQGREVRYVVQPEQVDAAARWMAALADEWDARLQRIKRLAEATGDDDA
jgi:DNA-binding transcriptional ArsR family regulator